MGVYDQVYKAYADSVKNDFWDAWGIVASPMTVNELRAECMERMVVFQAGEMALEKVFGLVVIPHPQVERDKVYIVDEALGRMLLGQTEGANI